MGRVAIRGHFCMPNVSDTRETTVRCPLCTYFVLRGVGANEVEVNCSNTRCRATIRVSFSRGTVNVSVVDRKKQA